MPRKRRDRRFTDPNGDEWDSTFEWLVFSGLTSSGLEVRRCDERDSLSYTHAVTLGRCLDCDSSQVVQDRRYTPDLFVCDPSSTSEAGGYFIECKGYWPAERRSQIRSVAISNPNIDLRILFASERKLTKAKTNVEYVHSYLKLCAGTWNKGALEWRWP